jgi:hypothetical protein
MPRSPSTAREYGKRVLRERLTAHPEPFVPPEALLDDLIAAH